MKKRKIFAAIAVVLLLAAGTAEVFANDQPSEYKEERYTTVYDEGECHAETDGHYRHCVSEQNHGACRQGLHNCRKWCD